MAKCLQPQSFKAFSDEKLSEVTIHTLSLFMDQLMVFLEPGGISLEELRRCRLHILKLQALFGWAQLIHDYTGDVSPRLAQLRELCWFHIPCRQQLSQASQSTIRYSNYCSGAWLRP